MGEMRGEFSGQRVCARLSARQARSPAGAVVVELLRMGAVDPTEKLLVVVHPDSLAGSYETGALAFGADDARMTIAQLAADWKGDVAVLLGDFSDELDRPANAGRVAIANLVRNAWAKDTVLAVPAFGEDLEHAAAWLITELAADRRPGIVVTGAWADTKDGCVMAVADVLRRYCNQVQVPDYTPCAVDVEAPPAAPPRAAARSAPRPR